MYVKSNSVILTFKKIIGRRKSEIKINKSIFMDLYLFLDLIYLKIYLESYV